MDWGWAVEFVQGWNGEGADARTLLHAARDVRPRPPHATGARARITRQRAGTPGPARHACIPHSMVRFQHSLHVALRRLCVRHRQLDAVIWESHAGVALAHLLWRVCGAGGAGQGSVTYYDRRTAKSANPGGMAPGSCRAFARKHGWAISARSSSRLGSSIERPAGLFTLTPLMKVPFVEVSFITQASCTASKGQSGVSSVRCEGGKAAWAAATKCLGADTSGNARQQPAGQLWSHVFQLAYLSCIVV